MHPAAKPIAALRYGDAVTSGKIRAVRDEHVRALNNQLLTSVEDSALINPVDRGGQASKRRAAHVARGAHAS